MSAVLYLSVQHLTSKQADNTSTTISEPQMKDLKAGKDSSVSLRFAKG